MPLVVSIRGKPVQAPLRLPLLDQLKLLLALYVIPHNPRAAMACNTKLSIALQSRLCFATSSAMVIHKADVDRQTHWHQTKFALLFKDAQDTQQKLAAYLAAVLASHMPPTSGNSPPVD